MERTPTQEFTFRVRLTRDTDTGNWRITLYDAQTGTYVRFTSLAQLDAFFHIVTCSAVTNDTPLADT